MAARGRADCGSEDHGVGHRDAGGSGVVRTDAGVALLVGGSELAHAQADQTSDGGSATCMMACGCADGSSEDRVDDCRAVDEVERLAVGGQGHRCKQGQGKERGFHGS